MQLFVALITEDPQRRNRSTLFAHVVVLQIQIAVDVLQRSTVTGAGAGCPEDGDFDCRDCGNMQLSES